MRWLKALETTGGDIDNLNRRPSCGMRIGPITPACPPPARIHFVRRALTTESSSNGTTRLSAADKNAHAFCLRRHIEQSQQLGLLSNMSKARHQVALILGKITHGEQVAFARDDHFVFLRPLALDIDGRLHKLRNLTLPNEAASFFTRSRTCSIARPLW
ncbi:MAG: hypothetical protein IPJ36_05620 [Simplicispira sp.]|nr:hypothetical protein [Simplicispira sp.]